MKLKPPLYYKYYLSEIFVCYQENDSDFFPFFKTNGSHDPRGQIRGQSKGQKVIAPKHAYFRNFLTEMESFGNFLQNDTKFVQISQVVVGEILQFEIWRVPPFLGKTTIFKEAYLQNYRSDFNKIENIGFFILTLQTNQISCKSKF